MNNYEQAIITAASKIKRLQAALAVAQKTKLAPVCGVTTCSRPAGWWLPRIVQINKQRLNMVFAICEYHAGERKPYESFTSNHGKNGSN